MRTCRRAWNVADRRNPGKLPIKNPFAAMGLESSDSETPTATLDELQAFRAKAIEMGFPSLATAALIGWEWLQREVDIFATFEVAHYRPKEQSNTIDRFSGDRQLFWVYGRHTHPQNGGGVGIGGARSREPDSSPCFPGRYYAEPAQRRPNIIFNPPAKPMSARSK
jgi:hypothetical protein